MNSKIKKTLMIGLPILLCLGIAIPILCITLANNKTISISYQTSDANKGTVSIENESVKIKKDAAGSTASAKAGYSFVNWTKDGKEVSTEAKFVPSKENNKNVSATYVANFTPNKYNVSFVGGFEGSTYNVDVEQTFGSNYCFPTINPTREHYNFTGYYTELGEHVTNETIFAETNSVTLYAHWAGYSYTVTFDGNGSDETFSESIIQYYGSNYVLPQNQPVKEGFEFIGWFTDPDDGEGDQITAEEIVDLTSNITLYAHWEISCVAEGTLITMKDGSKKTVETVEIGDEIRTFDHENGEISSSTVCFIWETLDAKSNVFTLHFEDDSDVTVIQQHGFFDKNENKYVFINLDNAEQFIGHKFYNVDEDKFVELESVEINKGSVNAYTVITANHYNHIANGMLSMCDGIMTYIVNIFKYDDDLSFNKKDVQDSITTYGLFDKDEFLEKYKGWTSEEFDDYNLEYLKIAIGKGYLTLEKLEAINTYYVECNEATL